METKNETMYFKAVTYNGEEYNFMVTPEKEIYCVEFRLTTPSAKIEIKPNFVLIGKDRRDVYSLNDHLRQRDNQKSKGDKIFKWDIEPNVFKYLVDNKMIIFTKQMAWLYGFEEEYQNVASNAFWETRMNKRTRRKPDERAKAKQRIIHDIFE